MKVLIVGGGGREHAIATAVAKSKQVDKIYCAPGNAGIAKLAECVPIGVMEFDALADFAKENQIDLAIIGPDDPLVGRRKDTRLGDHFRGVRGIFHHLIAERHIRVDHRVLIALRDRELIILERLLILSFLIEPDPFLVGLSGFICAA